MKRKTLASLVLAGVMAATMVPTAVFAAGTPVTKTTTVGYSSTGSGLDNGRLMVYVPANTTLTDLTEQSGFDVTIGVYNGSGYAPASDTNPIGTGKSVNVKVKSTNGFKLQKSESDATGAGAYTYKAKPGEGQEIILQASKNEQDIGTFIDKKGNGDGSQGNEKAVYSITGKLQVTTEPVKAPGDKTIYTDTLTYTFTGQGLAE